MENTEIRNYNNASFDRSIDIFPEEIINSQTNHLFQHRHSRGRLLYLVVLVLTSMLLASLFLIKVPATARAADGQEISTEYTLFQLLVHNGVDSGKN